ncbi:MAG: hypothetical protein GTO18_16130 [Anaerolineales bacterium]|nr:hypothetical protein [Anaerolineales bacterium]
MTNGEGQATNNLGRRTKGITSGDYPLNTLEDCGEYEDEIIDNYFPSGDGSYGVSNTPDHGCMHRHLWGWGVLFSHWLA